MRRLPGSHNWTAEMPHLLWSATKAVAGTTVGMAVKTGELDIDASICDSIDVGNPESCKVTTRHLMEHATGWAWRETYEGQSPTASSVVGMLYGGGKDDMAHFVTSHALRDLPGTSYSYSSGNTVVQSAVAHAVLTKTHGDDYLDELLFGPLGITSANFERDGSGVPVGSSTLYLNPRDMARYGVFLLQDGCWDGERLVPEGWMARSVTPAAVLDGKLVDPPSGPNPGWNLWLNTPHPATNDGGLAWPDAPAGSFAALGHWRQSIYVLPHHGVVVARTGDDRDGSFQHNDFLARVTALVEALPMAMAGPAEEKADEGPDDPVSEDDAELVVAVLPPAPGTFTEAAFPPPKMGPVADSSTQPPDKYDVGLLSIGTSFAAMHGCACRYIAGRSEDACRAYIKIQPDIAKARFDDETQTVTAKALGMAKTRARPAGDGKGCALVP